MRVITSRPNPQNVAQDPLHYQAVPFFYGGSTEIFTGGPRQQGLQTAGWKEDGGEARTTRPHWDHSSITQSHWRLEMDGGWPLNDGYLNHVCRSFVADQRVTIGWQLVYWEGLFLYIVHQVMLYQVLATKANGWKCKNSPWSVFTTIRKAKFNGGHFPNQMTRGGSEGAN